ncbi:MAG TPA: helix-turn-helix domain-containing protein [Candidatus Elarobacter sp.]|nr:helix-turn-helix domain-containing protein [Candidatus Elarobacter sp.]
MPGWCFAIPNTPIDAANRFDSDCRPFAEIPAWWSGFLFHVLTPRQLSLYLYLAMLGGHGGVCHPTVKQILQDLGLSSESAVFEALAVLEEQGFILRALRRMRGSGSRRNVYQRAACEYTVLKLLELGRIDGCMRPAPGFVNEMSDDAKALRDEWLRENLGPAFQRYAEATDEQKTAILAEALHAIVGRRA